MYDIIAYPPMVRHEEFINMNNHQEIICIGVSYRSSMTIDLPLKLTDAEGKFRWLFERIFIEHTGKKSGDEQIVKSLLKLVIQMMQQYYSSDSEHEHSCYIVDICLNYIHDHFNENLDMPALSKLVNVSCSYLTRIFKKKTGTSPIRYMNLLRVETAKRLMCPGNIPIKNVYSMVGYSDQSYFSKIFKRITKQTPRKFMATYNQEEQNYAESRQEKVGEVNPA